MTRTLLHSFDPPAESPVVGPTVGLEVSEIEDAGIREVLQTPGTAYGAWSILDALLTPTGTGTPFIFKEPLGQAREVKVALSGLFGRFVARAYLERYFKLSIFAHLGSRIIDLDRRRKIRNPPGRAAVKLRRASGGRTSSSKVGVCRAGSAASRRSWKECRRAKPADRCR